MGFIISGAVINPSYYISALTISGGSSETRTRNTTIDSSGNMYICGSMKPSTNSESYIAKFDNTGAVVWQTRFAGVYGYDETIGIIVDATGNVYTTGTVTVSSGREYISIFKFNSSGTLQWQRILGNVDYSYRGTSIDVDSSGNIYVGGRSYTTPGSSRSQVFIAKYDSSANLLWQRQLGTSNDDNGVNAIKVDSSGSNVYIAGTVDNGNFYQISIVAKYNSSGAIQWQRTITKSGVNNKLINANGLGLDSSNNVYIVGNSNITTPSFGYILKYDSSGTEQWQRFFTDNVDSQQTTFQSVAVDGTGNAYVAGGTGSKAILVKYDTSGSIQWQRTLNSNTNTYEFAYDISINSDSLFFVAMTTVTGSTQGLIGKLPLDGSRTGSYSIGAYSFTYAASSLTGSAGSLASSTSSITEAAGEGSSSTSTFATSTPTLARTLASVGAAGGAIASGMTMGGTGLGMVISSYVAPPTIGQAMYGGYYAGSISATGNGVATHYLIIAPKSTGETSYVWSNSTGRSGIISDIDGYANTVSLAALSASNYPGFAWARSLTIGGFTDWYIPAKNELNTIFYNLCPVITPQTGGFSANANAVSPQPTSSWTTGSPSQTSAIAFRVDGSEAFSQNNPPYWMSTDAENFFGDNAAWAMTGYAGGFNGTAKNNAGRFRAIRKVAI